MPHKYTHLRTRDFGSTNSLVIYVTSLTENRPTHNSWNPWERIKGTMDTGTNIYIIFSQYWSHNWALQTISYDLMEYAQCLLTLPKREWSKMHSFREDCSHLLDLCIPHAPKLIGPRFAQIVADSVYSSSSSLFAGSYFRSHKFWIGTTVGGSVLTTPLHLVEVLTIPCGYFSGLSTIIS